MANQHPKYGDSLPCNRRDNSYKKRQWRLKKFRENVLHARYSPPDAFGWKFQMAGYYFDDISHNGLFRFYTYNKSCVRRWCNRITRRRYGLIDSRPNPAWYKRVVNYVDEVI